MISSHCTSMREGEREIECERGREREGERERVHSVRVPSFDYQYSRQSTKGDNGARLTSHVKKGHCHRDLMTYNNY